MACRGGWGVRGMWSDTIYPDRATVNKHTGHSLCIMHLNGAAYGLLSGLEPSCLSVVGKCNAPPRHRSTWSNGTSVSFFVISLALISALPITPAASHSKAHRLTSLMQSDTRYTFTHTLRVSPKQGRLLL